MTKGMPESTNSLETSDWREETSDGVGSERNDSDDGGGRRRGAFFGFAQNGRDSRDSEHAETLDGFGEEFSEYADTDAQNTNRGRSSDSRDPYVRRSNSRGYGYGDMDDRPQLGTQRTPPRETRRELRVDERYDRMMDGRDEHEPEFRSDTPKAKTWDDIRRQRRERQGIR